MRFFALALATLVACAPPISRGGEGDDTDAGRSTDAGSSTDAGTSGPSGSLRACVLSPDGSIDSANCTRLDDDPPRLPTLDFGTASPGAPPTLKLRLFDDGPGPLHIASLTFADAAYTSDAEPRDLEFGESTTFTLTFAPTTDGDHATTLTIATDDSAHPNVALPVTGSASGFTPKLCVDPSTIAFGSVGIGQSRTRTLSVTNCGQVPVVLTQVSLNGAADFSLPTAPELPTSLSTGDSLSIAVTFQPTSHGNVAAELDLEAGEASQRIPITGAGAVVDCTSRPPTATIELRSGSTDITPSATVGVGTTVTFDGSGSSAPYGLMSYAWSLESQPAGASASLTATAGPTTDLAASAVGDYVIELAVTDERGCASAPVDATLHVSASPPLHVQLTWAQSYGDLDLHLLGPDGQLYDRYAGANPTRTNSSDCFWWNCTTQGHAIDWGLDDTTQSDQIFSDDPTLDLDQAWGNGPENITTPSPFPATYTVVVYDYCDRQMTNGQWGASFGAVTASVRIFVNGQQEFTDTHSLTQRDKWTVATITVAPSGTVTVASANVPVAKTLAQLDACSLATN